MARSSGLTLRALRERTTPLTVPEAGAYLGLSARATYRAIERGDLPGVLHLGRRILVSAPALVRLLEDGNGSPNGAK